VAPDWLRTGPDGAPVRLILAHGAGAGMESRFLATLADLLGAHGLATWRFEFAYMAARRQGGGRRPPPRAERLVGEFKDAVAAAGGATPLVIGGKSMGGRVASLVADELFRAGRIVGLFAVGYPFHPPGRPGELRTRHLVSLKCPMLIVQGERDPFGARPEVEALALPAAIRIHWMADGDHDLAPRGARRRAPQAHLAEAAQAIAEFAIDRVC
jgi:predicted alpha/beta-hydrolase family hydrolase